jgi:hypothetical protein
MSISEVFEPTEFFGDVAIQESDSIDPRRVAPDWFGGNRDEMTAVPGPQNQC